MEKAILHISIILFIILTLFNSIFFIEIFQDKDLKEFYFGEELSDNYSDREKQHMNEVKDLTSIFLTLNLLSLCSILLLRKTKISFKKTGKILIYISIIFFVFSIFYQNFHTYVHLIFFRTDTWLLPANSILIQKYPLSFFRDRFILLNTLILLTGILLRNNGFSLKRFLQNPQRNR